MLLTKVKPPEVWTKFTEFSNVYSHLMSDRPAQGTGRLTLKEFRINTLYATCDIPKLLARAKFFKGVAAHLWNAEYRELTASSTWHHGGFFSTDILRAASFAGGRFAPPRVGLKGVVLLCDRLTNLTPVKESAYNGSHSGLWPNDYNCSTANILGFMYVEHTEI